MNLALGILSNVRYSNGLNEHYSVHSCYLSLLSVFQMLVSSYCSERIQGIKIRDKTKIMNDQVDVLSNLYFLPVVKKIFFMHLPLWF